MLRVAGKPSKCRLQFIEAALRQSSVAQQVIDSQYNTRKLGESLEGMVVSMKDLTRLF